MLSTAPEAPSLWIGNRNSVKLLRHLDIQLEKLDDASNHLRASVEPRPLAIERREKRKGIHHVKGLPENLSYQVGKFSLLDTYVMIMMLVAGAAMLFLMLRGRTGGVTEGCMANQTSPFGQAQQSAWVDLPNEHQASTAAGFGLEYPEFESSVYTEKKFRAYTEQVFEVWYEDSAGNEGMRYSKAHTCGMKNVYIADFKFKSMNIEEIDGKEVSLYGDGKGIGFVTWDEGEYSYCIQCLGNMQPYEDAVNMMKAMK